MTAFKPRTKKRANDIPQVIMRVTIPKPQMNIIKSLVAAFMPNSSNDASAIEGEEQFIVLLVNYYCRTYIPYIFIKIVRGVFK